MTHIASNKRRHHDLHVWNFLRELNIKRVCAFNVIHESLIQAMCWRSSNPTREPWRAYSSQLLTIACSEVKIDLFFLLWRHFHNALVVRLQQTIKQFTNPNYEYNSRMSRSSGSDIVFWDWGTIFWKTRVGNKIVIYGLAYGINLFSLLTVPFINKFGCSID